MGYRMSSFVDEYRRDGIVALRNALNRRTEYLSENSYDRLKDLHSAPESHPRFTSLVEKRILVPAEENDEETYRRNVGVYSLHTNIVTMYIMMTLRCNYDCRYCLIEGNLSPAQATMGLDPKTAEKGIDLFLENATGTSKLTFVLHGGEPLLDKGLLYHVVDYVEEAVRRRTHIRAGYSIAINTNGSLIDDAFLDRIAKNPNVTLVVSVDGRKDVHDAMRVFPNGAGTYDTTVRSVRKAVDRGIGVGVSLTVGRHNVSDLTSHVMSLVQDLKVRVFAFNFLRDLEHQNNPANHDIGEVFDAAIAAAKALKEKHGAYEDKIYIRRWPVFTDTSLASFHVSDCDGVGCQIVLTPTGKIGPCSAYVGSEKYFVPMDSITGPLGDHPIWQKWLECSPVRRRGCLEKRCPDVDFCGGGCPYNAEVRTGDLQAADSDACLLSKKLKEFYVWEKYESLVAGAQASAP